MYMVIFNVLVSRSHFVVRENVPVPKGYLLWFIAVDSVLAKVLRMVLDQQG